MLVQNECPGYHQLVIYNVVVSVHVVTYLFTIVCRAEQRPGLNVLRDQSLFLEDVQCKALFLLTQVCIGLAALMLWACKGRDTCTYNCSTGFSVQPTRARRPTDGIHVHLQLVAQIGSHGPLSRFAAAHALTKVMQTVRVISNLDRDVTVPNRFSQSPHFTPLIQYGHR